MPDSTLPLDDLTQQIAQRRAELERLRQEFETRQTRLTDLEGRRAELRAQLQQVETDIQTVIRGSPPAKAARVTTAKTTTDTPPPNRPPRRPATCSLADALVELACAAGRPLTAKELAQELVRRQFPTTGGNFPKLVEKRLTELVKQGVLRRAEGRRGIVLGSSANETTVPAPKAAPAARRKDQPTLRSLLTKLLQKRRKPMATRDLVEQVLATGYQTSSKNFTKVVWLAVRELEGVENVKGQGWRLKKR